MTAQSKPQQVQNGMPLPLDNDAHIGDGRVSSGDGVGDKMSTEVLTGSTSAPWMGNVAENANNVMQQMVQVGANIEHLLLLLQETSKQAAFVRQRLEDERRRPAPHENMSQAERAAWQAQRAGVLQALETDLGDLTRRVATLSEESLRAEADLQRLQGESLPAAQLRDLLESFQRSEKERQHVDQELQSQRDELRKLALDKGEGDNFSKRVGPTAAASLKAPAHKTHLASSAPAEEAASVARQGLTGDAMKEQLAKEILPLIDGMLRSQSGAKTSKGHVAQRAPIDSATAALQTRWSTVVSQMATDGWMDVNQLIQWVMREAYVNNTADLKHYAYKVKFFTDLKKCIREELHRARQFQSVNQDKRDGTTLNNPFEKLTFSMQPTLEADGSMTPAKPTGAGTTSKAAELDEYIKDLDAKLNSVGDDAQLAQIDLQSVTQKQQQALQTLSSLSKVLHETSMAIIRKIGS